MLRPASVVDFTEGQGVLELVSSPWDSEIWPKLLKIKLKVTV